MLGDEERARVVGEPALMMKGGIGLRPRRVGAGVILIKWGTG